MTTHVEQQFGLSGFDAGSQLTRHGLPRFPQAVKGAANSKPARAEPPGGTPADAANDIHRRMRPCRRRHYSRDRSRLRPDGRDGSTFLPWRPGIQASQSSKKPGSFTPGWIGNAAEPVVSGKAKRSWRWLMDRQPTLKKAPFLRAPTMLPDDGSGFPDAADIRPRLVLAKNFEKYLPNGSKNADVLMAVDQGRRLAD